MNNLEATQRFREADNLFRAGRYAEALAVLDELNEVFPDTKNIMFPRALCLEKLNRTHEAWSLCKRIIEIFDYPRARELQARLEGQPRAASMGLASDGDFGFDQAAFDAALRPQPSATVAAPPSRTNTTYLFLALILILALVAGILYAVFSNQQPAGAPSAGPETVAEPAREGPISIQELSPDELLSDLLGVFVVLLLILIPTVPLPLYGTLLFSGKLPHDEFLKDYLNVFLMAWGTGLLSALIPCVGWILALFILYKVYDLGLLDFIILIGLNFGYGVLMNLIAMGLLRGFGYTLT